MYGGALIDAVGGRDRQHWGRPLGVVEIGVKHSPRRSELLGRQRRFTPAHQRGAPTNRCPMEG